MTRTRHVVWALGKFISFLFWLLKKSPTSKNLLRLLVNCLRALVRVFELKTTLTAGPVIFWSTVPFRLICPVTRHKAFGPALISVHVTRHINFGHMWLMVYSKFWSKNSLKSWKCRSKFGLSHVTPQVHRMSKCDHYVTGHSPGRINWNSTVLFFVWPLLTAFCTSRILLYKPGWLKFLDFHSIFLV